MGMPSWFERHTYMVVWVPGAENRADAMLSCGVVGEVHVCMGAGAGGGVRERRRKSRESV